MAGEDLTIKIGGDSTGMQQAAQGVKAAGQTMQGAVKSIGDSFSAAASSAAAGSRQMMQQVNDIGAATDRMAQGLGSITSGFMGFTKSIFQAANSQAMLKLRLDNVYRSATEAKRALTQIEKMEPLSPFKLDNLTNAAIEFKKLGNDAVDWLPRAQELAAFMDKDISFAAQRMSKALSGSAEGWESLRNEFGITGRALKEFGAVLTTEGNVAFNSAEALKKNGEALRQYIDKYMIGSAKKFSETFGGKLSTLETQIKNLKVAMGEGLVDPAIKATEKLTELTKAANAQPKATKEMVTNLAIGGTALGVFGFGLTKVIGFFRNFTGMFPGQIQAITAWGTSWGYALQHTAGFNALRTAFAQFAATLSGVSGAIIAFPVLLGTALAATQRFAADQRRLYNEMQDMNKDKIPQANKAIGVWEAYNLAGKTMKGRQEGFREGGMSKEELVQAQIAMPNLIAGAKTEDERKRLIEIKAAIHEVVGEWDNYKTAQTTAVEASQVTGRSIKEIDHALDVNSMSLRDASLRYKELAGQFETQLRNFTKGSKEYNAIEDDMREAEKKAYDAKEKADKEDEKKAKAATKVAKQAVKDKKEAFAEEIDAYEFKVKEIERLRALEQQHEAGTLKDKKELMALRSTLGVAGKLDDKQEIKILKDEKLKITAQMGNFATGSDQYRSGAQKIWEIDDRIKALTNPVATAAQNLATTIDTKVTPALASVATSADKAATATTAQAQATEQATQAPLPDNFKTMADFATVNSMPSVGGYNSTVTQLGQASGLTASLFGPALGNISADAISKAAYNQQVRDLMAAPQDWATKQRDNAMTMRDSEAIRWREQQRGETFATTEGQNANNLADVLRQLTQSTTTKPETAEQQQKPEAPVYNVNVTMNINGASGTGSAQLDGLAKDTSKAALQWMTDNGHLNGPSAGGEK